MMMQRNAVLALVLGVLVLVGIAALMIIVPSDVSTVTTTADGAAAAAQSSDSGFPIWLFLAIIPAIVTPFIAIKMQSQKEEKEKNKREDPTFEKPKRDNAHYTIGSDGELVEVFDDEDDEDIEFEQRR